MLDIRAKYFLQYREGHSTLISGGPSRKWAFDFRVTVDAGC